MNPSNGGTSFQNSIELEDGNDNGNNLNFDVDNVDFEIIYSASEPNDPVPEPNDPAPEPNDAAPEPNDLNPNVETDNEEIEQIPYSSFKNLKVHESSIEIVAKVDAIIGPDKVGPNNYSVYKVIITNDVAEKLQLVVWNDEIPRISSMITLNAILHIDAVYCKPVTNPRYNKGTEDYELIVQSNSTISVIGHCNSLTNSVAEVEPAPIVRLRDLLVCGHKGHRVRKNSIWSNQES